MKKDILFLIFILSSITSYSQIKPYYADGKEYRSSDFHRFQISTNYRMFVRDIPLELEYAAFDTYTVGVFVGFLPKGTYKYRPIKDASYYLNTNKLSMFYGVKVKSWLGSECFDGFYGELNYLFANIIDYKYQEFGMLLGGQFTIFNIAFVDLGFGFGIRNFFNTPTNNFNIEVAGKFNTGIGIQIK